MRESRKEIHFLSRKTPKVKKCRSAEGVRRAPVRRCKETGQVASPCSLTGGVGQPTVSLSPPTDHSGGDVVSPLKEGESFYHRVPLTESASPPSLPGATECPHRRTETRVTILSDAPTLANVIGRRFGRRSLQTPPRVLLRSQAMQPRRREGPFSQKMCQAKNNVVPVELWSAVPILAQAPPADASPGVRPGRAYPGPWLQRSPSIQPQKVQPTSPTQRLPNLNRRNTLSLPSAVHSTKPTALTPLSRLRRIVPEMRQHLLQKGPGQLPWNSDQTHQPRL